MARGKADGMDPRKLAEFIQAETGVSQSRIEDIKVLDAFSFIAVPFEDAEKILHSFQNTGGRSIVSHAKEKGDGGGERRSSDRGDRPERRSFGDKKKPFGKKPFGKKRDY